MARRVISTGMENWVEVYSNQNSELEDTYRM